MPVYKFKGQTYNIPEEESVRFEHENPDALVMMTAGGKRFAIPLGKRDAFMEKFEDGGLYSPAAKNGRDTDAGAAMHAGSWGTPGGGTAAYGEGGTESVAGNDGGNTEATAGDDGGYAGLWRLNADGTVRTKRLLATEMVKDADGREIRRPKLMRAGGDESGSPVYLDLVSGEELPAESVGEEELVENTGPVSESKKAHNPSWGATLGKSIGAGFARVGTGIVDVLQQLTSGMYVDDPSSPGGYIRTRDYTEALADKSDPLTKLTDKVHGKAEQWSREAQPYMGEKGFLDLLWDGELDLFLKKGLATAGESLPMTLSWYNPWTATANAISMAGGNYREETLENPDIPEWKRAAMAIGSAAIEQAVEKYADPVMKYVGGKKGVTEVTKEATENLAKRIVKALGGLAKDAGGEGLEEVATNFGNDVLGEMLDLGNGKDYGLRAQWQQLKERNPEASLGDFALAKAKENVESFIGGALAGAYTSGTVQVSAKGMEYAMGGLSEETEPGERLDPARVETGKAFDAGYTMEEAQAMTDARNRVDFQREKVSRLLTADDIRALDGEGGDAVGAVMELARRADYTEEQKQAALDYVNARATYDGMIARAQDDIESRIRTSDELIDSRVRKDTAEGTAPMVQEAELKDGRRVYVIDGEVVMTDDGTMVAAKETSESVLVRDGETGNLEWVGPHDIMRVSAPMDAAELKQEAADNIREAVAQAAADKMEGRVAFAPGDVYETQAGQVQVVADNGDGTVTVSVNGGQAEAMRKEDVQAQVDERNLARLAEQEAAREAERAEEQLPDYRLNDEVMLTGSDGRAVRAVVTQEADADGMVEVMTDEPVDGKVVHRVGKEQLRSMGDAANTASGANARMAGQNRPNEALLNEVLSEMGLARELVEVAWSADDLPASEKSAAKAIAAGELVEGWYNPKTKKVWLYAPNLNSKERAREVVLHELVSHGGLRRLLGDERFGELCDHVWQMMDGQARRREVAYVLMREVSELTDEEYGRAEGNTALRRAAADEWMAHLAEGGLEEGTMWEKVKSAIREALRKMGFNLELTDGDVRELLRRSYAEMRGEEKSRQAENEREKARNGVQGEQKGEAEAMLAEMEEGAELAPDVELTIENWDALFGSDGRVNTPLGEVKMGENQFAKQMRQGRNGKLGMIKPTLETPDVIVEEKSEAKEGEATERGSSYIFVKAFRRKDGSRYYYFTSVTVSREGKEVVVSSQEKSRNRILRLLMDGDVIWRTPKDATTSSAERQGLDYVQPSGAETGTKGSGLTPQSISSQGKDSSNTGEGQENGEENSPQAENEGENGQNGVQGEQNEDIMPMVGKGDNAEPDWYGVSAERGYRYLYEEAGLTEDEADEFVRNNQKATAAEEKRVKGKEPKMGTSLAKWRKEMAAWRSKVDQAGRRAAYWNDLKALRDEATTKQREAEEWARKSNRERMAEIEGRGFDPLSPTTAHEAALWIVARGFKLTPAAFQGMFPQLNSTNRKDRARYLHWVDAQNGHESLESVVESYYGDYPEGVQARLNMHDIYSELSMLDLDSTAAIAELDRMTREPEDPRDTVEYRAMMESQEGTEEQPNTAAAETLPEEMQTEDSVPFSRREKEAESQEEKGYRVSEEVDENGAHFVQNNDGGIDFGEIGEDTGLTPAPIRLSEGYQDKEGKGYGLKHIEANHGTQIRKAGFASVESFVSNVAQNYDRNNIRIGKRRDDGALTYLIYVNDKHDNTLFVELSRDGSYWSVNSGGVFRKGYLNKKETVVKTEPRQPNNAVSTGSSLSEDKVNGIMPTEPNGKPTVSESKDSTNAGNEQVNGGEKEGAEPRFSRKEGDVKGQDGKAERHERQEGESLLDYAERLAKGAVERRAVRDAAREGRLLNEEERISAKKKLLNTEPVAGTVGQIKGEKGLSARQAAERWAKEHLASALSFDTEAGRVTFDERSVKTSLAHGYNQAKLDAIPTIPEGLDRATYIGSRRDWNRSSQNPTTSHYFAYPVMYDGRLCYVFCRAKEDVNANRLYVHEVFMAENIKREDNTLQTAAMRENAKPHGGIAFYKRILSEILVADEEVYTRPALEPRTGTGSGGVDRGQTEGATTTSGDSPQTSESKDRKNAGNGQVNGGEKEGESPRFSRKSREVAGRGGKISKKEVARISSEYKQYYKAAMKDGAADAEQEAWNMLVDKYGTDALRDFTARGADLEYGNDEKWEVTNKPNAYLTRKGKKGDIDLWSKEFDEWYGMNGQLMKGLRGAVEAARESLLPKGALENPTEEGRRGAVELHRSKTDPNTTGGHAISNIKLGDELGDLRRQDGSVATGADLYKGMWPKLEQALDWFIYRARTLTGKLARGEMLDMVEGYIKGAEYAKKWYGEMAEGHDVLKEGWERPMFSIRKSEGKNDNAEGHKRAQLDIVLENNPADDKNLSLHTWIRELDDVKTYQEALAESGLTEDDGLTPDFSAADMKQALKTGKMTVYSSKPIRPGIFVTPSQMEAKNYAGAGKVYSKRVSLDDVAWIDAMQGQYAKVGDDVRFSRAWSIESDATLTDEAKAEMKEIKAKAEKTGSWMKAPNGEPTNLGERQWLQVRTKAFKVWFGDWELAALIRQARNAWSDPRSKGKYTFAPSERLARAFREQLGHEIEAVVLTDDAIRHIRKNHSENEEMRGQVNLTPEDIALIPYVLNEFDTLEAAPNYNDKQGNRATLIKKRINGLSVIATIEKGKSKEFVVTNWQMAKSNASDAAGATPKPNARDDFDAAKIRKEIEIRKSSIEKSSKIVDENGEPAIAEHGTPARFTAFDKAKQGKNDAGWLGAGFYFFTKAPGYAAGYASGTGNIMRCFLNIRTPYYASYEEMDRLAEQDDRNASEEFTRGLIEDGYDGVYFDENLNGEAVAFYPNQIKSATMNRGTFDESDDDIRFSVANQRQEALVSNAERAVKGIRQEKATPEQWLKMIEKGGGLKAGEDKWLGLSEWLKDKGKKPGTLTKQEILDYIGEHRIQIEEEWYGDAAAAIENDERMQELRDEFDQYAKYALAYFSPRTPREAAEYALDRMADQYGDDFREGFDWEKDSRGNVRLVAATDPWSGVSGAALYYLGIERRDINPTRKEYTTSGLDAKREVVLTVPSVEPWNEDDDIHFGEAGGGRAVAWTRFGETTVRDEHLEGAYDAASEAYDAFVNGIYAKYGLKQWDASAMSDEERGEWNRLYRERNAAQKAYRDSNVRVLVIDEIQSKRHQEGREKGYTENSGIPDAPFDKNWHELAMKRMLRLAAEEGFDKVAWTKGAQQASRYGLGKIVERVISTDKASGTKAVELRMKKGETVKLDVDQEGRVEHSRGIDAKGKRLSEVVGESLAKKIMDREGSDATLWDGSNDVPAKVLEGDDLQIGGEGMKGFYDVMLPSFMGKYGKKWGVKVGELSLPDLMDKDLEAADGKMWSVDVTDEMKKGVMEGQVMFSRNRNKAQKRALETAVPEEESSFKATDISSADGAKILKNLDNLASELENSSYIRKKFLSETSLALGAANHGSNSQYATFKTKNGKVVTIRLSEHNASVSTFDNHGEDEGISIVISRKANAGMTNDGEAHVVEYFYSDKALRKAEGKPMAAIVRAIEQALYSGEFTDPTGLAERQEAGDVRFSRLKQEERNQQGTAADEDRTRREGESLMDFAERMAKMAVAAKDADSDDHDRDLFHHGSFHERQARAAAERGIVAPGLAEARVNVVNAPKSHDFRNFEVAKDWAKRNLVRTYTNEETGGKGEIRINNASIKKFLSIPAVAKSDNIGTHLFVLRILPEVIRDSIDAEQHADYNKVNGVRIGENGINPDVLMHRLFGAVNIGGQIYRVKITVKETNLGQKNAYTYEATKIELLEDSNNSMVSMKNDAPFDMVLTNLSVANLLQNVEKSYDPGKKLLDESEKKDATEANGKVGIAENDTRFSRNKRMAQKRALETASLTHTGGSPADISSADGAKILQKLENLAGELEIVSNWRKNFLSEVGLALGAAKHGSNSQYATFETKNGKVVTIRLSGHNASVSTFDNHGEDEGISIVVSRRANNGLVNDGEAHVVEYYYPETGLRRAEGKPLAAIVRAIGQALYSGEFTDPTGLAERQEVNGIRFSRAARGDERERAMVSDHYEREMQSSLFQFREAMQDSMLSLKRLMEMIVKATGKAAEDYENAYMAENALSSKNHAEQEAYGRMLLEPLLDAVKQLAKAGSSRDEVTRYMMAKHGLERNEKMARRDAAAQARKELQGELRNAEAAVKADPTDDVAEAALEAVRQRIADREEELFFRNRGKDYGGVTGLTGKTELSEAEAEARRMVADFEKAHDVTELWARVGACTKATLQKVYLSGQLSKAKYGEIASMYEWYIPLRGFDETTSEEVYGYLTSEPSSVSSPVKAAKGRRSVADDPIATIANMADSAIVQGNRNLMKQRFLKFVMNRPSDAVSVNRMWLRYNEVEDLWEAVTAKLDENDSPEEILAKTEAFEAQMEALAESDPDHYKRGREAAMLNYRTLGRNINEHQVQVKLGGQDYIITLNGNPRAAQALNGLTNPDSGTEGAVGAILKAGQWVNRQMSAFYTTRNPEFVLSNFLRDMLYANTTMWVRESANYALRFNANFVRLNPARLWSLLRKHNAGELDMDDEVEMAFHQFMMNGGETGYTVVKDIEARKKEIAKYMKRGEARIPLRVAWTMLGDRLDEINRAVENCARFAAFLTSRQMGRSIDRSVMDAKEVSVNFNKKGSGSTFLGKTGQGKWYSLGNVGAMTSGIGRSFYVFWNAAVQGTTNFGRLHKRHTAKALALDAGLFMLGAVLAGLGGGGDDDDDDYWNLPSYVRRSNICFRIPGTKSYVSIPLGIEQRAIYGLGELAASVLSGRERLTGLEIAKEMAGAMSSMLPVDMMEGSGDVSASALVPSYIKPVVEAAVNKDWKGMPIYKDTPWNKDDPEWTKAGKRTNRYMVEWAETLNAWTGGDDIRRGWVNINPSQVEHVLEGTFGGTTTTINKLVKMTETAAGKQEFDWRNMLLASRVVKSADDEAEARRINAEYFKYYDEYKETKRIVNHYEKQAGEGILGVAEKLDFWYNSPAFGRYQIVDGYSKGVQQLTDALKEATDEEERKYLEAELTEVKRAMVEEIRRMDK